MRFLLAFTLSLFITFAGPALAQTDAKTPIGTIAEIEGTVAMTKNGEIVTAAIGEPIYLDETIETGPESKLLAVFIDDSELTLGENAQLKIDEYVFDAEATTGNKGRFSVLRGAFIMATGLINKTDKPDVKIETNYGSIGIRGTVVWGGPLDDQYNIFVQEGEVFFSTDRGRVTLKPGQGTSVSSRRAIPARAKEWGQDKIGRAVQTVALRNAEAAKLRVQEIKQRHQTMRSGHKELLNERIEEHKQEIQNQKNEIRERREKSNREHRPIINKEENEKRKKELEDKKSEFLENRQERLENRTDAIKDLPAGDLPQDIERREKMHLKKNQP